MLQLLWGFVSYGVFGWLLEPKLQAGSQPLSTLCFMCRACGHVCTSSSLVRAHSRDTFDCLYTTVSDAQCRILELRFSVCLVCGRCVPAWTQKTSEFSASWRFTMFCVKFWRHARCSHAFARASPTHLVFSRAARV